nr:acyltransferase [uncultured Campylobacter sp.]
MGGAYISQKILSNKILVWFGLISFPLYLWHWPLLSFARILESETPNRTIRIFCVLLSVLLAWVTYKFIERPLRFKNNFKFKIPILFAIIVLIGILGYIIYLRNGKNANSITQFSSVTQLDPAKFLHDSAQNCKKYFPDWSKIIDHECMMQKPFGNKIAIIGDSHANHLYLGIA